MPSLMQESDEGRGRLEKKRIKKPCFATLTFNKVAALTNIFFLESNLSNKWNQQEGNPGVWRPSCAVLCGLVVSSVVSVCLVLSGIVLRERTQDMLNLQALRRHVSERKNNPANDRRRIVRNIDDYTSLAARWDISIELLNLRLDQVEVDGGGV